MRPLEALACLPPLLLPAGCKGAEPEPLIQIGFSLPAETSFLSQTEAYKARVDYLGGATNGLLLEYTLRPGEGLDQLRRDLQATEPGESVRLEVTGLAADPAAIGDYFVLSRASSGRFSLSSVGPQQLTLFLGQVDTLNRLSSSMQASRRGHSATRLADDTVLIAGGAGEDGVALSSSERFDGGALSLSFGPLPSLDGLEVARVYHTAQLLSSEVPTSLEGLVLLAGGDDRERLAFVYDGAMGLLVPSIDLTPEAATPTASGELFDPRTGRFSTTGAMQMPRTFLEGSPLDDGGALICGGLVADGASAELVVSHGCERFSDGAFASSTPLETPRVFHQVTRLLDGTVLVTGGSDALPLSPGSIVPSRSGQAERFLPDTGAMAGAGSMALARAGHRAVRLQDGTVLITGGIGPVLTGRNDETAELELLDAAEIFDPETGSGPNSKPFRLTEPMVYPRAFHTATLLPDGQVLITGGIGATLNAPLPPELYDPARGTFLPLAADTLASAPGLAATPLQNGVLVSGGAWYPRDPTAPADRPSLPEEPATSLRMFIPGE